jgi:hypothetical protein
MTTEERRASSNRSGRDEDDKGRASKKPDEYRFAENLGDGGGTVAEREYEDYVLAERASDSDEPDVLLDVPVVKVDELGLEVNELHARVSLEADVLNLLKLHVGADVFIGEVKLEITGVEAQALLKVRLANVARILDRVMTTVDRNPQLLEGLVEGAGQAVAELGEGAGTAVEEVGEGAGEAVEDVGEGAGAAVEDVGEGAGSAVESTGGAVEDVGQRAGEALADTGETAKRTVRGAARTARKAAPGADQPATKQRSRTRGGQGTKRSSRQPSGRDPDHKRRSR